MDEVQSCYFAALIYGLSVINEKERDLGMVEGSTTINADALVNFVRRKGDHLVHLMSQQNQKSIFWREDEWNSVAREAAKRFPGERPLNAQHFMAAQEAVLPKERHKPKCSLYAASAKLRTCLNGAINGNTPTEIVKPRMGRPPALVPAIASPAPTVAQGMAEALGDQIAETLIDIAVQALAHATQKLQAK